MNAKIKCDKCESTNVENYLVRPLDEPEPVTMSEYIQGLGRSSVRPEVLKSVEMLLHCKSCGHKVRYSTSGQKIDM